MKTGHLVQTVNGGVIRETSLTSEQQANVKAAVMTYSEWLEKDLAKKPNKFNACQNTVSIDSMSEHKVFCISRLAKKEADAKSKDLFTVLDSPTSAVVRSSPTSKRSSAL